MKHKTLLVASLVVALVLGMSIIPAGAYFTDSVTADGGVQVNVKPTTDIEEVVNNGVKEVKIKNNDDSTIPVFVRAGVFAAVDEANITITGEEGWSESKNDFTEGDYGWYYYEYPLEPKELTSVLKVKVEFPVVKAGSVDDTLVGDTANVIVVYESTPVLYDEEDKAYADWTLKANPEEGGN